MRIEECRGSRVAGGEGSQTLRQALSIWEHTLHCAAAPKLALYDSGDAYGKSPSSDILDMCDSKMNPHMLAAPSLASLHARSVLDGQDDSNGLDSSEVLKNSITTLMLKRLPRKMQQNDLCMWLCSIGFEDGFDFIYMPHSLPTNANLGYAFVNLSSPQEAAHLVQLCQGRRVFEAQREELLIVPAMVQGIEGLINMSIRRKLHKLRNINWRPYVRDSQLLSVAL
mmetsp:Transcript_15483/g.35390  ORF Transcript_15483/g.35390 Transcript_15483/m.35390 type:complete len:225 (-) Transcript_15483:77-751(-)